MKTVIEMAEAVGITDWTIHHYGDSLEDFAELVRADERKRLATKLVQDFKGAFGDDTCASWAVWIRGEKK